MISYLAPCSRDRVASQSDGLLSWSYVDDRMAEASNAKYHDGQSGKDYQKIDIWSFRPRVADAWKLLSKDRTRFDWE